MFTVFLKINNINNSRFVINVPKVLEKRSVYRNFTKRVVGEVIGKQLNNLNNIHYDFSFKMKKIITRENKLLLEKEISQMIKDLQISQNQNHDQKNHS